MNASAAIRGQVRRALARYEPPIVKLVTAARRILRRRCPSAVELVYDNYNALVFGYGPSEHASEAVFSIAAYPRWVNFFFLRGAHLPDPQCLLHGTGRQVRSIRLSSATDLERGPIRELIRVAIARMAVPFAGGRGRTVIRAMAATRRARRPRSSRRPRRQP